MFIVISFGTVLKFDREVERPIDWDRDCAVDRVVFRSRLFNMHLNWIKDKSVLKFL